MKPQPRYQPGDKIGGRYQVHQALIGGMGEVYLCLDLEKDIPFALKTFQQRYLTAPKLRQAFENEIAIWVALEKHPNIVRCFWMDILNNQPFMILEWIAGEESRGTDLRSWLRRGPLDLRTALDFTIDVCRGLVHAQEKQPGLVHRDLKPENILVAQGRLAKITDFGLAQIVEQAGLEVTDTEREMDGRQSLLGQGGVVGTPPYMAPEQWRGDRLDARADIYAVGCILYELLMGRPPFEVNFTPRTPQEREKWFSAWKAQQEHTLPPVLAPGLQEVMGNVVYTCLAKRCEERFATVDGLLQQLGLIYQQQFAEPPKTIPSSGEFGAVDYSGRGVAYDNLQRYDEALVDYDQAIQLDPTLAQVHNNRGLTYHNMQRYEEALSDYDRAIQLDPTLAQVHNNRGLTCRKLQRYEEALTGFNRAIQLDPTLAQAYSNRGFTYHELQRYDEALADYDQAIQLDPNYAPAYNDRGLTYRRLQRYDEALADFNRAIQLDPTWVRAYSNRGATYHELQRYGEALTAYDRAIQLDPNYAPAYSDRGLTYRKLQRYEEALSDYDRAVQLYPTDAQAYTSRGRTYARLQRYEEALADFDRAIQLDPTDAQAYIIRGSTYEEVQRYEEALTDYDQAIQLDPNDARAHFNRGFTYHKLQRYDEALADYSRAIQLDRTDAGAYSNRGAVYVALQRYDEALADFNRAIQLDPTLVQAYFNIGFVLRDRGKLREALPYFEKVAQLGFPQGAQCAALIRQKLKEQWS